MKRCLYRRGYKYQLADDYKIQTDIRPLKDINTPFIELTSNGRLLIKRGYAWDGATKAIDTKNFMRGSLVHDALYQLLALRLLKYSDRAKADLLLKQICLQDGMSKFRAWYVHKAVQMFGKYHINNRPLLMAP